MRTAGPPAHDRGEPIGYGFEQLGLHRISLDVFAFNPRARHVYEKAGFVTEGLMRHALYWEGEWVDAYLMAALADEWSPT